LPVDRSVTRSPDSPLFERRTGLGGPTPRPSGKRPPPPPGRSRASPLASARASARRCGWS